MPPSKSPRGQIAHFRIYPEMGTSRLFFHVRIFQTVEAMHTYLRSTERAPGRFCKGMCSTYKLTKCPRRRPAYTTPEVGEIVLAARWCGSRIISHECTHAALGWARRRGLDPRDRGEGRVIGGAEERVCGVLGDLVGQIARQLWNRGIVK